MPENMTRQMNSYIAGRIALSKITGFLKDNESSHLLEITGKSGSGKSYFVQPILESMAELYENRVYFSPHPLNLNHFTEIIRLLTKVSEEDLLGYYQEFRTHIKSSNKFDFFYFITERLNGMEMFHQLLLVIDDCDVLDKYTRDFLQYLVSYLPDAGIQIVALTQERLFPFWFQLRQPG